jgi:hypothetical protein
MVKEVPFKLVSKADGLEIREYPPIILVKVSGLSDNASFSILFDYIQGANISKRKVPMTAPVISSEKVPMTAPVISQKGSFAFVLPDGLDIKEVPLPTDPRVKIVRIGRRTLAVLRFSGRTSVERTKKFHQELLKRLLKRGIKVTGDPFLMRYNSPFVPWPFRRNEAAIEISYSI